MKKHTYASALLGLAICGSAYGQALDGSNNVDMGGTGNITGNPIITFPSEFGFYWSEPGLQLYTVPAGQLTGLDSAGAAVKFDDLLPLKTSSISVMQGVVGGNAAPTGTGVLITGDGIDTNTLTILDTTTLSPVEISVDNGDLLVGGVPVGSGSAANLAPAAAGHTMADIPGGTLTTLVGAGASITITPFKMARTELTFGEWYQGIRWACENGYNFASTTPTFYDNSGLATPQLSTNMTSAGVSPVAIKFPGNLDDEIRNSGGHSLGSADHPVVGVNWFDAVKWCNARSEMDGFTPVYYRDLNTNGLYDAGDTVYKTGEPAHATIIVNPAANGLRLPSEPEWEWAARGGNMAASIYPWGTTSISGAQANYQNHDFRSSPRRGRTTPVGSFPAGVNPYGLHDMAGNVWEWCADIHPNSAFRVGRGGSWDNTGSSLQVSSRLGFTPAYRAASLGFRIVRN